MGTNMCPFLATNHMSSICQCQVMSDIYLGIVHSENIIEKVIQLVVFISVDHQGAPPGRCGMRCLMRHAQGFTQSHWMPLPGEYFCRITPVAAMVINVGACAISHKSHLFS